ncbi:MAG: TetR/AcrR family transcriptional regulator [Actinomycetota bacterium]|nr:TetR/AcrR family transcriptional regulator [Actinomycetota bacterium]
MAGALAIIEETGSAEAVTLRSVAREVGIAAPSIYAHFANRQAILEAVAIAIFEEIGRAVEQAVAGHDRPVERLLAGCEAYASYGTQHPGRYRVLFSGTLTTTASGDATPPAPPATPVGVPTTPPAPPATPVGVPTIFLDDRVPEGGGEVLALLVDGIERCIASGDSRATDAFEAALGTWVALHGAVTLHNALKEFPWPDARQFTRSLVFAQARITDAGPPKGPGVAQQ